METPSAVVRACLRALPRLQAEESLLAVRQTGVASGVFSKEDAQAIQRAWIAQADVTPPAPVRKRDPAALAAMGIGLQIVEKPRG